LSPGRTGTVGRRDAGVPAGPVLDARLVRFGGLRAGRRSAGREEVCAQALAGRDFLEAVALGRRMPGLLGAQVAVWQLCLPSLPGYALRAAKDRAGQGRLGLAELEARSECSSGRPTTSHPRSEAGMPPLTLGGRQRSSRG
jgi:hypothetical protein